MWTNEYRKRTIRNILLAILSIAAAAGLLYAMLNVRAKNQQEDALLVEQYSKQQVEQTAARQQAVEDIDAEYRKDMETVSRYLPGIVCWGDTLTAGSNGSVSFPDILQKYIDTYICDIYDFRASIENANEYSRLKWDSYKVSIPVVNMGVANEDTNTVLGRSGAVPFVLTQDVLIPAGTERVQISISSLNGKAVSPLKGGNGGVNNVSIDGIEGTLSLDAETSPYGYSMPSSYYFTRLNEGEEYYACAGTAIKTAASEMYTDYIHIVCIGTYGGFDNSPSLLVEQTKQLLSRQTNNSDRYLVIGLCYQTTWRDMSDFDTLMTQAFGDHYVNIRNYLCSDGMADAGITPTEMDRANAGAGIVPVGLRSTSGDAGLSAKAYRLLGKLVYDRMEKLGYFDEVTEELYINEVRKELLKNSPDYFSNIIKNW